ncbi:hypothetical protein TNCT_705661 [Trichonephila clavata]|uniref:Uncharacterized protein n=1 Tax=Trichonephila clavata TaxID=2740835 RepID=A0A8X6KSF1_TRICU|nr:hypothetical protein TNCT_705661 [Trichonephila clavata]
MEGSGLLRSFHEFLSNTCISPRISVAGEHPSASLLQPGFLNSSSTYSGFVRTPAAEVYARDRGLHAGTEGTWRDLTSG